MKVWNMTFPFKQVIFRFQLLILQGVSLAWNKARLRLEGEERAAQQLQVHHDKFVWQTYGHSGLFFEFICFFPKRNGVKHHLFRDFSILLKIDASLFAVLRCILYNIYICIQLVKIVMHFSSYS